MRSKLPVYSKYAVIFLFLLLVAVMIVATVVEKISGTDFVVENIYSSPLFILLWAIASIFSAIYIMSRKWRKRYITLFIHLSFVIILLGAFITHVHGLQGYIHLRCGEPAVKYFTVSGKDNFELPFSVGLEDFQVENYAGTQSAMDYVSKIRIEDGRNITEGTVSMNNIFEYRKYRFYQSGFDKDRKGTTLSVYYALME